MSDLTTHQLHHRIIVGFTRDDWRAIRPPGTKGHGQVREQNLTAPTAPTGGLTLFADIEGGNPRWTSGGATDRPNVLHGFLTTLANLGFTPGVSVSTSY